MSNKFDELKIELLKSPQTWLVTGAAGFIGSHLVENLLALNQIVVGLDNFATGHEKNIKIFANNKNFTFINADVAEFSACQAALKNIDYVSHQAALGSVPRSIEDPLNSHRANVDGFINIINAAREAKVKGFVFASSSSVYGDEPTLPKVENRLGKLLSPYAATKKIDEVYAEVFSKAYSFSSIGLRYFNVFGPRQDPHGAYAAVIPKWVDALSKGEACTIFGDGETSRDFCYVNNVVRANILAACAKHKEPAAEFFNVALGQRTTLKQLYYLIRDRVAKVNSKVSNLEPILKDFRAGDIKHSLADISYIKDRLGYEEGETIGQGLDVTVNWFLNQN